MIEALHILSEDFLTAFGLMEGEVKAHRSAQNKEDLSVGCARIDYVRIKAKIESQEQIEFYADKNRETGKYELHDNTYGITIYGNGGVHRYYVLVPSGRVVFSSHHASKAKTQDAKALGFLTEW
jgi:hypothetical protein